jgi:alkanesulfonate monooxygenase SsuD/methylene tetrahydromethanopterin reductase-like flavin-dependent oxidoreductase (luciferase family)
MKFGLMYTLQTIAGSGRTSRQAYAEMFDQAALADRLGFDLVCFSEHHFRPDDYCPSVLAVAAAVAGRTSRIRIGTAVLLLPLHHPLRVAEDAAVIDVLSGGRLVLGVGLGYHTAEFLTFGVPLTERASRADEAIDILQKSWAGRPFAHEGRHYRFPEISVTPKPVQQPHPPLWVAATTPAGARRAARVGSPLYANVPLPLVKPVREAFAVEATRLGHDLSAVDQAIVRLVYCAPDVDQAWAECEAAVLQVYRDDYRRWGFMSEVMPDGSVRTVTAPDDPAFERARLTRDRLIVGDPERCRSEIDRCRKELGINHVLLFCPPLLSHERAMASLELFAREVVPHFQ